MQIYQSMPIPQWGKKTNIRMKYAIVLLDINLQILLFSWKMWEAEGSSPNLLHYQAGAQTLAKAI